MDTPDDVLIIGAGHAGGTLAALLRQYGHTGPITLLGEEPLAPYQRPPLSKAWLKGEADADSLALKPLVFYAEQRIAFCPNTRATRLDRAEQRVHLADGATRAYGVLVIATGARAAALPIPGCDLDGVGVLRTAADAENLKARLGPGKTLAVVGGGYIGLEVAASARSLGAEVVLLERETRLLARVADPTLSGFFMAYHRARGVRFELGCGVVAFEGAQGRVEGLRLADGRRIACDLAVIGVGARPNDELASAADLECAGGIVVDLQARTSDPAIYAIGDVTCRPMPHYGRMFRPESVPSALEQAKQAACAITARPPPSPEVPWNWSDQYDLKLQIAGLSLDADTVLVRGDPLNPPFAVFHLLGGRVRCVEAVNAPPEFMMGRQLIASGAAVDLEKLVDRTVSMKLVAA